MSKYRKELNNRRKPNIFQRLYRKFEIFWEGVNELDFSSVISVTELGLDESLVVHGAPSCNKYLIRLFKELNITEKDSILDIGCAKGGAIRCMSKFSFGKIDGIEISDILADIAKDNFLKLKENRVTIKNVNATMFKGYANYNFFYLYNPFPKEIMNKTLFQIKSQINSKKEIVILYNNPVCHEQVLNHGFYKIKEFPGMWNNGIFIYSNINQ